MSQTDFLRTIYQADRDHRVNIAKLNSGFNSLSFENLLPEKNYTLCAYFENQHRSSTQQVCVNFTTQLWGTVLKASITFSNQILSNQLNSIFCYYVKAAQS